MNTGRRPGTEGNRAADLMAKLADRPQRRADRLLNMFAVGQQRQAGRRRLHAPTGALHQPGLKKLLQLAHLQADGRLR